MTEATIAAEAVSPRTPAASPTSGGEVQNVCVMIRVRPFSNTELSLGDPKKDPPVNSLVYVKEDTVISVLDPNQLERGTVKESMQYDHVFWSVPESQKQPSLNSTIATQGTVFQFVGLPVVDAVLDGKNSCVFAYGQTGSGKTHTMLGSPNDKGLIPRVITQLFDNGGQRIPSYIERTITASFLEIYNEKVKDLLEAAAAGTQSKNASFADRKVRYHPDLGTYVDGLKRVPISTPEECDAVITAGTTFRTVAATQMNDTSSRSHAILQLHVKQKDSHMGVVRSAVLNLVDLAGSERIKMSGVTGAQLAEAKNINLSLTTLRRVIDTLLENSKNPKQKMVAPYRESMLTWVLADSLGGNCKTTMLGTVSPHVRNLEDSLNTLRYALKAKAICCTVKVNSEKCKVVVNALKSEMELIKKQLKDQPPEEHHDAGLRDKDKEMAQRETQMRKGAMQSEAKKEKLRRDVEKSNVALKKAQTELTKKQSIADETARIKEAISIAEAQRIRANQLIEEEKELEVERQKAIVEAQEIEKEITAIKAQQGVREAEALSAKNKEHQDMASLLFRTATRFGNDRKAMAAMKAKIASMYEREEELKLESERLGVKATKVREHIDLFGDCAEEAERREKAQQLICDETMALRTKRAKSLMESISFIKSERIRLHVEVLPAIQSDIDSFGSARSREHRHAFEEAARNSQSEEKELKQKSVMLTRQADTLRRQIGATDHQEKALKSNVDALKSEAIDLRVVAEQQTQDVNELERVIASLEKQVGDLSASDEAISETLYTEDRYLQGSSQTVHRLQPVHEQLRAIVASKSAAPVAALPPEEEENGSTAKDNGNGTPLLIQDAAGTGTPNTRTASAHEETNGNVRSESTASAVALRTPRSPSQASEAESVRRTLYTTGGGSGTRASSSTPRRTRPGRLFSVDGETQQVRVNDGHSKFSSPRNHFSRRMVALVSAREAIDDELNSPD